KRVRCGIVEYFLKWKDYDNSHNSWEPIENINSKRLITSFENQTKECNKTQAKHELRSEDSDAIVEKDNNLTQRNKNDSIENTEMPKKKIAEKVISVTHFHGKLMILIKMKGIEEPVALKAKVVHKRCPQVLIKYYETNIVWDAKI
ncbi:chromobox protein 3-like, partial [Aphis craccivora]